MQACEPGESLIKVNGEIKLKGAGGGKSGKKGKKISQGNCWSSENKKHRPGNQNMVFHDHAVVILSGSSSYRHPPQTPIT